MCAGEAWGGRLRLRCVAYGKQAPACVISSIHRTQAVKRELDAAAPARRGKRARTVLLGGRTDSESESWSEGEGEAAVDASEDADHGAPAPAPSGEQTLSRLEVVRRRLARTREALRAYSRVQWRLLQRLREHHRRFFLRHGHAGTKEAAAAQTQAKEEAGLPSVCASCGSLPLPLARHCLAHILQDTQQVLYVAGEDGAPRLRTAEDPAPKGPVKSEEILDALPLSDQATPAVAAAPQPDASMAPELAQVPDAAGPEDTVLPVDVAMDAA